MFLVKTLIGKLSEKEGTSKAHHGTFIDDDVKGMRVEVRWDDREPFHVVPEVYNRYQGFEGGNYFMVGNGDPNRMWSEPRKGMEQKATLFSKKYPQDAEEFIILLNGGLPSGWENSLPRWTLSDPVDATHGYSEKCLTRLAEVIPRFIGRSADLAPSNKVYLHDYDDFQPPESPWGCNIRYGVHEHAMAGISNGIALYESGLIPFAATFLTFSDYMKNAMRLSALSHAGVINILTHDSIGLGEDGPTHQPVEHLTGLRAIPLLHVFRPADGNETAGAYMVTFENRHIPSAIALSRQKVAAHTEGTSVEGVTKGGYIVSDNSGDGLPEIILIGTGSELCLSEGSAKQLRSESGRVRVVSLACWWLFNAQPCEYKEHILPRSARKRVSVEAGSPLRWREYVGEEGVVHGVNDFGASGAYLDTFKDFGFTEENITRIANSLLEK